MESQPSVPAPPSSESAATVAEDLPELYRTILDRVAGLERLGARAEAARIRTEATRAYSNAWDEGARRILVSLLARADRATSVPVRPHGFSLRRRSTATR